MADTSPPLTFDRDFDAQTGVSVDVMRGVVRVSAGNGGPYTFTGTNSFLIGHDRVAILDPGPSDDAHRDALVAAVAGRPVEAIILSHTHKDHSALARAIARDLDAPLWSAGPHRLSRPSRLFEINHIARDSDWGLTPDRTIVDGENLVVGGIDLVAIATPGHCANHLCFGIMGTDTILTGDHVMGWNSTIVAVPDGSMGDYLTSLEKLIALPYTRYVPAHGGPIANGPEYARALLAHRLLRNRQVEDAVGAGATKISQLVDRIYPTLTGTLRIAAGLTLEAHVEYLAERGTIAARRTLMGWRLSPA